MAPSHAEQYAKLCSVRPALSDFETSPIVITGNPLAQQQALSHSHDPAVRVAFNGPSVPFESEVFKGHMTLYIRGMPDTVGELFEGKKRTIMNIWQGKFKRPVAVDDLMIGQEFYWDQDHKVQVNMTLARLLLKAAATIRSSRAQTKLEDGYMCSLKMVASNAQLLNVSPDGQQPAPLEVTEDARLLSPALAGKDGLPLSPDQRRKLMDSPAFTKGLTFDTEHVYTFASWLHHLNFQTLHLNLGRFLGIDLCRYLPPGAPLCVMIKDVKTQEYVVNAAVWHKRIVEYVERWDAAKGKDNTAAES